MERKRGVGGAAHLCCKGGVWIGLRKSIRKWCHLVSSRLSFVVGIGKELSSS